MNDPLQNPAVFRRLCGSRIILQVMGLLPHKFAECGPSPWMVHGRDIRFLWLLLLLLHVQFLRRLMPLFYLFQGIDVLVIDAAVQGTVKGPDYHDFRAFAVVYLVPPAVQHPVMAALELDAVSAVHRPLIQYRKNQIDFVIGGLRFEYGFGMMDGERELCIEFLYVGVRKFVCSLYGRDPCQAQFNWQARL